MNCTTRSESHRSRPRADRSVRSAEADTAECLALLGAVADGEASFAIAALDTAPARPVAPELARWIVRLTPAPAAVRLRPPL